MQVCAYIGIILCLAVNTHTRSVKETGGETVVEGTIPLHTSFAKAEENPGLHADFCTSNPCKNGAQCLQNSKKCICRSGYVGVYCETCKCTNGVCKENSEGISECTCPSEWGKYTATECRECECGKGANCTFDVGIFKTSKVCLCKVGYQDVNGVCKEIPFSSTTTPEEIANTTLNDSRSVASGGPTRHLFTTFSPRPSTVDDRNKTTSWINLNGTTVFPRTISTQISTTEGFSREHSLNFTRERGSTVQLTTATASTAIDLCEVNPCKNGGICRMEGNMARCYCISPFTGKLCEKDPCFWNPCFNGGQCNVNGTSFQCECGFPYSGRFCEKDPCTKNPCQNGGKCFVTGNRFNCLCKAPYAGILCETDPCVWNPCKNGGICKIENEVPKCFCKEPFTGNFCDSRKNDCVWNPCKNGGVCKTENEIVKCFCKEPFTGEFCDSRSNFDMYVITLAAVSGLSIIIVTFLSCLLYRRYPAGKTS